eukprot:TRINITY_DN1905_c0_g1_i2.p1 TRINITY_DN1905_c0_g1~~TRINITY_DN1905_c0_g1_i2.p1  ORF type:complete len:611 (-),score=96.40 TRINITY_DN1905_c0_g1_i2:105-1895(-)
MSDSQTEKNDKADYEQGEARSNGEEETQVTSVGPFMLGKTLGVGATGKVKLGVHKTTGFKVAIKIISKKLLDTKPGQKRKIDREIAIMKLLRHPNVLRLYDVYESSTHLFLILEYVDGGELFDYLVQKGSLSLDEAKQFLGDIITGLEYCHAHLICHRDLKPENLLLTGDKKCIKIADFGMASILKPGSLLVTSCGSPHYASPEIVRGEEYDGRGSDIWSCGVILYALVTGSLPFDDDNIRNLLLKVKSGVYPDLAELIQRMLTIDPQKRITIPEIKTHAWIVKKRAILWPSAPTTEELYEPLPIESINEDIIKNLKSLGWEGSELFDSLNSKDLNMPKVFCKLLSDWNNLPASSLYQVDSPNTERSLHSSPGSHRNIPSLSMTKKSSSRRRSDSSHLKYSSKVSSSPRGSHASVHFATPRVVTTKTRLHRSGGNPKKKKSLGTRTHGDSGADSEEVTEDETPSIIIHNIPKEKKSKQYDDLNSPILSSLPKKSWFSTLFGNSKEKQGVQGFGIHTMKSLHSVQEELSRCFEALTVKAKISRTKFKAKFTKEKQTVKFFVEITQLENGHFVNFVFLSGKTEIYTFLCYTMKQKLTL